MLGSDGSLVERGVILCPTSEENPGQIASLIDWQSTLVSPIFIEVRFSEFLPVIEDYALDTSQFSTLPQTYNKMDADSRKYAEHKLKETKLAKGWDVGSGTENNLAYKDLRILLFEREIFVQSGEVSEEIVIPLRACLIELSKTWNDLGITTQCPVVFSGDDPQKRKQEFEE